MASKMFTLEEFKNALHAINNQAHDHLIQCGMEMLILDSDDRPLLGKKKLFIIQRDESSPLREFMDLIFPRSMQMHVELTVENVDDDPQTLFNALSFMEDASRNLLNLFFSMAERTMQLKKDNWEAARKIEPEALGALEAMFRNHRMRKAMEDGGGLDLDGLKAMIAQIQSSPSPVQELGKAVDGLKASIANMVDPPKSTN